MPLRTWSSAVVGYCTSAWLTLTASDYLVQAPLSTVVEIPIAQVSALPYASIQAIVDLPTPVPATLGVAGWISDQDGRWFQAANDTPLQPGRHTISIACERLADGQGGTWDASVSAVARHAGLTFWNTAPQPVRVAVDDLRLVVDTRQAADRPHRLTQTWVSAASIHTGERWTALLRPEPFPANPFADGDFRLDAVVTGPDGATQHLPGFAWEPMRLEDGGDRETAVASGPTAYAIRFRPRQPGCYAVQLEAQWADGTSIRTALPPLVVTGPPWDDYVRIDRQDPRFLSADDAWWWAPGLNLHALSDRRSRERLGTLPTPDRGSAADTAYLERCAAAGIGAIEVWMSPWNLGLEWRADWPGYHGLGRYHQGHAERLDRLLDTAWRCHIRVVLVIANHGQASLRVDSEWPDNPWNAANGGPFTDPISLFTDARALAGQEQMRRYLVGRYADHPALLAWKLWSEIDLTAAGAAARAELPPHLARLPGTGRPPDADPAISGPLLLEPREREHALQEWHAQAARRWHALDTYRHPVTTHWSGDFRRVVPAIAALSAIDLLCIDAYRSTDATSLGDPTSAAELLWASTEDPLLGLARFAKPVLVTEYGGSAQGDQPAVLRADLVAGIWASLVSGHGAGAMLWWHEWVDQHDLWQPYRSARAFAQGEDPRGGHGETWRAESADGPLLAHAWVTPSRIMVYIADRAWCRTGQGTVHAQATLLVPSLPSGCWRWDWWDADLGTLIHTDAATHHDGPITVHMPRFNRHIALKVHLVAPE